MTIPAKSVSELRDRTGAAMMDCKRALEACGGDMEAAVDHLRKAGLKSADKRAGRSTAEGRVQAAWSGDGRGGAMVALSSETDFVARTDDFKALLGRMAALALERRIDGAEALLRQRLESGTVLDAVKQLSGKLGENVQVPKAAYVANPRGFVGGYVHHNDKVGAILSLTTSAPADKAAAFLKSLGMHVVFARPRVLLREQVPSEVVEREKAVYRDSQDVKSRPEDKRERIVTGKLEKFYAGAVLLEQLWIHDDKLTVKKALAGALGPDARIESFALFQVGA